MALPKDAPGIKPPSRVEGEYQYPLVSPVFGTRPDKLGIELTWHEEAIPDIPGYPKTLRQFWAEVLEGEHDDQ